MVDDKKYVICDDQGGLFSYGGDLKITQEMLAELCPEDNPWALIMSVDEYHTKFPNGWCRKGDSDDRS